MSTIIKASQRAGGNALAVHDRLRQNSIELYATFRSEREDWIQGMVLADLGLAFMPECSVNHAGILSRPLVVSSVEREVCLVNMAGRQLSPAAAAFSRTAHWVIDDR